MEKLEKLPKKISELFLLNHYSGITKGGSYISEFKNRQIFWNYRILANGNPECVCDVDKKEVITTDSYMGFYSNLIVSCHEKWKNHKSIKKILKDEFDLFHNIPAQ